MSPAHKPDGYTTVSPYQIVDGATCTIEFLESVFDAVELRRFPVLHERVIRIPIAGRHAWEEAVRVQRVLAAKVTFVPSA